MQGQSRPWWRKWLAGSDRNEKVNFCVSGEYSYFYNHNTVQTTNLIWSIEEQNAISKYIAFFQKTFDLDVLLRAKLIKLSPVLSNFVLN
jgi:hypothetical protein